MRALILSAALWCTALPGWADARLAVLMDVLRIGEVAQILSDEGIEYGQELDQEFLGGTGGPAFHVQVRNIHAPEKIAEAVRDGMAEHLQGAALEDVIAFYAGDLGARIVRLENDARVAFADPEIEQGARDRFAALSETDPDRLVLIERIIASGDLVGRNVASSMNSNIQFMRGMVDGGLIEMTEEDMLADIAADMDAIEEDTRGWLGGFLTLAYSPLSDAEVEAYAAFSESEAGRALNQGFFAGFDPLYDGTSYALGRAVALNATSDEL